MASDSPAHDNPQAAPSDGSVAMSDIVSESSWAAASGSGHNSARDSKLKEFVADIKAAAW